MQKDTLSTVVFTKIPPNLNPGDTFHVTHNQTAVSVIVPQGCKSGQMIKGKILIQLC